MQYLIEKLTSLRKEPSETVVDYITRAEDFQYNLQQIGEGVSEQMLISVLLKGLTREYATFVTMVKFSKDKKDLEELKRDLINFEFDNKTNRKEESAFNVGTPIKCFTCGKVGHKSAGL